MIGNYGFGCAFGGRGNNFMRGALMAQGIENEIIGNMEVMDGIATGNPLEVMMGANTEMLGAEEIAMAGF